MGGTQAPTLTPTPTPTLRSDSFDKRQNFPAEIVFAGIEVSDYRRVIMTTHLDKARRTRSVLERSQEKLSPVSVEVRIFEFRYGYQKRYIARLGIRER